MLRAPLENGDNMQEQMWNITRENAGTQNNTAPEMKNTFHSWAMVSELEVMSIRTSKFKCREKAI